MKRILSVLLILVMLVSVFAACGGDEKTTTKAPTTTGKAPATTTGKAPQTTVPGTTVPGTTVPGTTVPGTTVPGTTVPGTTVPGTTVPGTTVPGQDGLAIDVKTDGAMTYAEYMAAELDTVVTVEAFVQAHQSWWDNKITVYAADLDGGYFFYNLACSEEDAAKLVPGTRIRVTGTKIAWSGEVEISDGTFTIQEGVPYEAPATDVTALLGTEELIDHQNKFVTFTGLTVAAKKDADGNDVPFLYNWDGSGERGNDLYFDVIYNGETYTFTVESYLCGMDTEVYQAVEALQIGDIIDLEGFLYWYEGVNPHITAVTSVIDAEVATKTDGAMTYDEYMAADLDTIVTVEAFVQAHQSWWDNKITVYAADLDGGYFFYNLVCSEEDAAKLVPGTRIRVTGTKIAWAGEVEISEGTFTIQESSSYIAPATDVTALLGTEELIDHQNKFVTFTGLTVAAKKDADGNDVPFLYNWDGSGERGNDLYFDVIYNGETYTFTVESYLCGMDTEVYQAVEALQIGQTVNLEGFLYWYEGVNPHITAVTVVD